MDNTQSKFNKIILLVTLASIAHANVEAPLIRKEHSSEAALEAMLVNPHGSMSLIHREDDVSSMSLPTSIPDDTSNVVKESEKTIHQVKRKCELLQLGMNQTKNEQRRTAFKCFYAHSCTQEGQDKVEAKRLRLCKHIAKMDPKKRSHWQETYLEGLCDKYFVNKTRGASQIEDDDKHSPEEVRPNLLGAGLGSHASSQEEESAMHESMNAEMEQDFDRLIQESPQRAPCYKLSRPMMCELYSLGMNAPTLIESTPAANKQDFSKLCSPEAVKTHCGSISKQLDSQLESSKRLDPNLLRKFYALCVQKRKDETKLLAEKAASLVSQDELSRVIGSRLQSEDSEAMLESSMHKSTTHEVAVLQEQFNMKRQAYLLKKEELLIKMRTNSDKIEALDAQFALYELEMAAQGLCTHACGTSKGERVE